MTLVLKAFRTLALAASLTVPFAAPLAANGIAGDYLAARQAGFLGDFSAAARYLDRAIMFDPSNAELIERAILAHISLGDLDQAANLGDRLEDMGQRSQLAYMAIVSREALSENYESVLMAIDDDRGLGPLADGLVRAWAELGRGDMSASVVAFDEVAQVQGLGPFATYHKAMALASVGDFESAAALFDAEAAGGMQTTRRGIMARAEILGQLDRRVEAVQLIDDAFGSDLDPELSGLRAALTTGEAPTFSHVTSARDGIAEVFYTLAGALSSEQNDDFTLLYARMAAYLRPGFTDALLLSAELLEQLGQYDLADRTYGRVPPENPAYHAAVLGRVSALRAQEQFEEALDVLTTLKTTHGDMPLVHTTHGDLLRRLERFDEATEAYRTALDLHSEVAERQWFLFYVRGITYERRDMWPEAEADFRRALELNPGQPQVLNYLGYSLVEKKSKLDEALDMIERAVAARPNSGYIVDSLGWALYRLGRYDEAVGHMERAAELMPIDPVVNDHLGDVYWAVGRTLEAEFQWKRALSFANWEDAAEEVDIDRIRRKLEVGLDAVLAEEGAPPLTLVGQSQDAED